MNRDSYRPVNLSWRLCLITSLLLLTVYSCASHGRKGGTRSVRVLTAENLLQINRETRFTYFHYPDTVISGLMLNWQPDSVLIQPRDMDLPVTIPTEGMSRIETVIGNSSMEGLAIGAVLAGGYFLAVKGYALGGVTFLEGLAKLLVPPAIIITAIGIGAAREKREAYVVPPGFQFDFETAKRASPK